MMGEGTKIEWADNTFNPWWGCVKISEACRNCYAAAFDKRVHGREKGHWGPEAPRRFFGDAHWNEPRKWNARAEKTGVRERVFCASMADVFEDRDDLFEHRKRLWDLIAETPHLDWLLLTKRPDDFWLLPWMEPTLDEDGNCVTVAVADPWPNVWLGVTAETQADADRRIPLLLDTPAVCRFVSVEPMIESVSLQSYLPSRQQCDVVNCPECFERVHLSWVIVGGESGPGARPMHPDWARSLRDQCTEAGVAFLFKQWGDFVPLNPEYPGILSNDRVRVDGSTRSFVNGPGGIIYARTGKKAAGRLLDGRTWDELPEVSL